MDYDLITKNGNFADGAENPLYRADMGIKEGKITKIEQLDMLEWNEK